MVASTRITQFQPKNDKNELEFFALVNQIKNGKARQEDIARVKGAHREIAEALLEGFSEQGLDGYGKAYRALLPGSELLKRWKKDILDKQQYAGMLVSDVRPEKIEWLWKPRLALGKLTVLDGDPGLGKSLLTLDLIARITNGRTMPDGSPGVKGGAVIITPEDGMADTIRPRLERAGADLTKVASLGEIPDVTTDGIEYNRLFTLNGEDLQSLEAAIERVNAKIVVIDPVTSILGGKDTYKDNEVRAALSPLKTIVEKHHVACIMVRHLTKSRGDNPLMAGGGSIAFVGLSRTALMVCKDKENEQVVFAHFKSNIGKLGESLTYNVVSDEENGDERPYIAWSGTTETSLEQLINPVSPSKNTGSNRQRVVDLLEEKAPNPLTQEDMLEALPGISRDNLKQLLKRMYDKGEIGKSERGLYCAK